MSETEFVESKTRAFRQRYPAKAGWFVCRINYIMGMELLPALLCRSETAARGTTWNAVSFHDGRRSTVITHWKPPFIKKGPGLSDADWFGTLRFAWRGTPVIVERHRLEPAGLSDHDLTLAATRDRSAIEDIAKALRDFWRSTMRYDREVYVVNVGGFISLPKMGWDDLILPGEVGAEIRSNVEGFLSARAHYRNLGLPYRRGMILVGPPGNGKTTAAKIIMASAKARPLVLSLQGDIKDSTIENAFREAASEPPAILLIEDLDRMMSSKNVSMAFLLNLLDGLDTYEGFLLIATSNEPERISPALLHRPSRFDRVFNFGLPGSGERRRLLALRGQGRFSDAALDEAAEASAGFTMAYVQEAVVNAMLQALHAGREPADADLLESVRRLKGQFKSSQKVTGNLPTLHKVGFHADVEAD